MRRIRAVAAQRTGHGGRNCGGCSGARRTCSRQSKCCRFTWLLRVECTWGRWWDRPLCGTPAVALTRYGWSCEPSSFLSRIWKRLRCRFSSLLVLRVGWRSWSFWGILWGQCRSFTYMMEPGSPGWEEIGPCNAGLGSSWSSYSNSTSGCA